MKYFFKTGDITVETDNLTGLRAILAALDNGEDITPPPVGETVRKHKKHQHKKSCPDCGKVCKGTIGVGIHRATVHGYVGRVKAEYLKAGKPLPWRKVKVPVEDLNGAAEPVGIRKLFS
jgi:hypothetical protein